MLSSGEWRQVIRSACPETGVIRRAVASRDHRGATFSRPFIVECDDGEDYFVKSPQIGRLDIYRTLTAEQIVANLGARIGAPVGEACIVHLPAELLKYDPELDSVDHGLCLPGAARWTTATLQTSGPATLDPNIFQQYHFDQNELFQDLFGLAEVTDEVIAGIVARPPSEWNISLDERVALAEFLSRRRDDFIRMADPAAGVV